MLGDRYFHDLIVDPKRYRYGGPIWLPGFVSRFVPLPDVVFLLDLPVDLAVRRKQEISKDDMRLLRTSYKELMKMFHATYVLDASKPLPFIVQEVERILLEHMVKRNIAKTR